MEGIIKNFQKTNEFVSRLTEYEESVLQEAISEGKWSIHEIVGHLYTWDRFNLDHMVPLMANHATLPAFPDHDTFNAESMTNLQNYSVEAIFNLFVETRGRLIESLLDKDKDIRFTIGSGKRKFSVESFIKIFLKHDEHHMKQMKEKLVRSNALLEEN